MMLPLARQNTTLILGILDHAKYCSFSQSIILRQITINIVAEVWLQISETMHLPRQFSLFFYFGVALLIIRINKLVLHVIQLILLHKLI